jgi:hypothetical protein
MKLRGTTEIETHADGRTSLRWYALPPFVHQEVMLLACRDVVWTLFTLKGGES